MITWLRVRTDEARVAMMFLTRLPVGRVERVMPISATAWAWPIAGMVLGAVFGAVHLAFVSLGFSHSIAIIAAMAVMLVAGGGFHEDGLADLADGIGGGGDPARRLAIMRDSRLGSYGAMALVLAFLSAFVLWGGVDHVFATAVAFGAVSRMGLPLCSTIFPSARKDGLGHTVQTGMSLTNVICALAIGICAAFVLFPASTALLAIAVCLVMQFCVCLYARRVIGGTTGDVLGSAQVLGGLAVLLVVNRF